MSSCFNGKLNIFSGIAFCLFMFSGNVISDSDIIDSLIEAEHITKSRCGLDLSLKWAREISHSPFVSTPVIHDVNADGIPDIIAVSHSELVTVLRGDTGDVLTEGDWPLNLFDKTFLSSPLLHDLDSDGMLDILLVSSKGEILALTSKGQRMPAVAFQLPALYIDKDWHRKIVSSSFTHIHDYISDFTPPPHMRSRYVAVDPHVLSTPHIVDVDGDGRVEELIITVSYYFDIDDYIGAKDFYRKVNLTIQESDQYVASSVVMYNITSASVTHTVHLDLTTKSSQFPAYLPHSPTIVDIDSQGGALEVIVGTLSGSLHVINANGTKRAGFPITINPACVQVLAIDTSSSREIEFVVADRSGNVICLNKYGATVWESEIQGSPVGELRLVDLGGSGSMMIAISASSGIVNFLHPDTGEICSQCSIKLGASTFMSAQPIRVSSPSSFQAMVLVADDGNMYLSDPKSTCKTHVHVGDSSYVPPVSLDNPDRTDLLLMTMDGTAMLFSSNESKRVGKSSARCYDSDFSPALSANPMLFVGVGENQILEVSSPTFFIMFAIVDPRPAVNSVYDVKIFYRNRLLAHERYNEPGNYVLDAVSSHHPSLGHLIMQLTNQQGRSTRCIFPIRFHAQTLGDLQWLLTASALSFIFILVLPFVIFQQSVGLPLILRDRDR